MVRFEIVDELYKKHKFREVRLPTKATKYSVGYDFFSNDSVKIYPNEYYMFWTDVKVKLYKDEFLMIVPRSSIGINNHLMLCNTVGIIDPDYYGNEMNDGNIGICLFNYGNRVVTIRDGDRIAQGIVLKTKVDVSSNEVRKGGIGSTNSAFC